MSSIVKQNIRVDFIFIMLCIILLTAVTSFTTTINDLQSIPRVTTESLNEGCSSFVVINPVDKFPHIFCCKSGNIYHSYLKLPGCFITMYIYVLKSGDMNIKSKAVLIH